jgi:hypothetical protein
MQRMRHKYLRMAQRLRLPRLTPNGQEVEATGAFWLHVPYELVGDLGSLVTEGTAHY